MSTARFYREHGAAMRHGDSSDHAQRMHEADEVVRDQWLAQGEYVALTKAIIGNWTSGNCVEYMAPLSQTLVAVGELDLHRHLWTQTIKRQVGTFFREYSWVRQQKLSFENFVSYDTEGFDEFASSSYDDHKQAAAFLLQRLMRDLQRWRAELCAAGLSTAEPDTIEVNLRSLKVPKIAVIKLIPNSSYMDSPTRARN